VVAAVTARILVTGSRAFTDAAMVTEALAAAIARLGPDLVVVHGAARGADELASVVAPGLGLTQERWPADWTGPCRPSCRPNHRNTRNDGSTYCPAAGTSRNQAMVDAGADLVLAFFAPGYACRGTWDCVRRAEKAGIRVLRYSQAPGGVR
jgi:hypothetical protein